VSGLGGWWHYWRKGDDGRSDPIGRFACGILAWKGELIYNGYGKDIVPDLPFFGGAIDARLREFQRAIGLDPDGVLGPLTGSALSKKRKLDVGQQKNVPDFRLCKLISLESDNDPVAQGVSDAADEGYAQIHMPFHTDGTFQQAWSPTFAVPWAADYLNASFSHLMDWDAAVVSYNQGGGGAAAWLKAGKPKYGSPYTDSTGHQRDHYTDCYKYLTYVMSSTC